MRNNNQRAILDRIFMHGSTTRASLAKELNLSKPAIADHLNILFDIGIVTEGGEGISSKTGGRKPIMIHFNYSFRYIIAIDLNYQEPIFALSNLKGMLIDELTIKVSPKAKAAARIELIKNAIGLLLNAHSLTPDLLCCIAISSPGVFGASNNLTFANRQFNNWFDEDIFKKLSDEYGAAVLIKNDVNTAAVGELFFGAGVGCSNLLYFSCGLGLGSGIILNGRLLEGLNFAAGEIFNSIDPDKLGNGTNLEDTISIDALQKRIPADIASGAHSCLSDIKDLKFSDIVEAYEKKDSYVLGVLREVGIEMACMISNITNLLTIETVVIGGEYIVFGDYLLPIITDIVSSHCHFKPKVLVTELKRHSGIFGLLYLAREAYFDTFSDSIRLPEDKDDKEGI
jgi:predicted NBD/HSP70 family sugar kinase